MKKTLLFVNLFCFLVVLCITSCKQSSSTEQLVELVRVTSAQDFQSGIVLVPGKYVIEDTVFNEHSSEIVYVEKEGLRDKEYWVELVKNNDVVKSLVIKQIMLSYTPADSSEDASESMKKPRISAWNTERLSEINLTYNKEGVYEDTPALKFKSFCVSDTIPLVGRHYNFIYENEGILPAAIRLTDWGGKEFEYQFSYAKDENDQLTEIKLDYYSCDINQNGETTSPNDLIKTIVIDNFEY